jgi:hypothetical protein
MHKELVSGAGCTVRGGGDGNQSEEDYEQLWLLLKDVVLHKSRDYVVIPSCQFIPRGMN